MLDTILLTIDEIKKKNLIERNLRNLKPN